MKKTITLSGVTFEEVSAQKVHYYGELKGLYACYAKPSNRKKAIYNDWAEWFKNYTIVSYGVCSHNCQSFSIAGKIFDKSTGTYYDIKITPTHKYIHKCA